MATTTISNDPSQAADASCARRRLLHAGVPETAICAAEAHGPIDWIPLAHAMDRLFMVGYGHLSQRRFLFTRDPRLGGLSPAEVLAKPDGVERVWQVASEWGRPVRRFR